jgi:predicted phosphodiesterase
MLIRSINDYNENNLNYAIKLLKRNIPISVIKKKTHLGYNEILYLVRLYNIKYDLRANLTPYTFETKKIGIISDTHIGSTKENEKYIHLALEYFIKHGISNIIHLGDAIQGPIDPKILELEEQTKAIARIFPKTKLLTIYLLCGNHEVRAFEDNEEIFNQLFARKDIKYLGTKESYIKWCNHLFLLQHFISKYEIDLPFKKPTAKISGHHHFYTVKKKTGFDDIYVPSLSDDIKREGESPAFLEATIDNNELYIEKKNVNRRVENVGLVYKKRI